MKTESKQLTVIERAAVALGASECEKQLTDLVDESQSITTITNPAGRDECHASAMKATKARTGITSTGKTARDDANAFSKAIIAEEKRLVAIIEPEELRLKSLRDEWDAKIEAEKASKARIELERQAAIQSGIDSIRNIPAISTLFTVQQLHASLDRLAAIEITPLVFGDRVDEAEYIMAQSIQQIEAMIVNRKNIDATLAQAEAQRIENERIATELAAQQAEAERVQSEALKAEAERQRAQSEELAKQRAELEAIAADQRVEAAKMEAQRVQMEEQERGRLAEIARLEQEAKDAQNAVEVERIAAANKSLGAQRTETEAEKTDRVESTEIWQSIAEAKPAQLVIEQPSNDDVVTAIMLEFCVTYNHARDIICRVADSLRNPV